MKRKQKSKRKLIEEAEKHYKSEVLEERKRRFLLVIVARWAIIVSYLISGLVASAWLVYSIPQSSITESLYIFGAGLAFLSIYNAILHYYHEKLGEYKILAQIQMIFDVFATSLIIFFTGGISSSLWSVYLLIILQSAFLFDRKIETLEMASLSSLSFSLIAILANEGFVSKYTLPFVANQGNFNLTYSSLKVFWVIASSFTVAIIASYLMEIIRQRERYLAYQSITDGLTKLYNHGYFHKRLSSEIARAKRYKRTFSIVLIDLDNLKQHNDTYGHQAGDILLKKASSIFKQSVRSDDVDTIYRYGGDEFAIIAPETNAQNISCKPGGAASMAERIRAKIDEKLPATVSIGISSFPHHSENAADLFKAADLALYKAKEEGKNRIVVASQALIEENSDTKTCKVS